MPEKTVLILGGGVGGVVTANLLRKELGREHHITLLDKQPKHYFAPSFPWVAVGSRQPSSTYRDLSLLNKKGIQFLQREVEKLDLQRNTVITKEGELSYDYLVVALGAELAPETVPGFAEAAHTYYHLDGAVRLNQALQEFDGGKVAFLICSTPFKCPAAPYEGAFLLDAFLRNKGIRSRVTMNFFTPEPIPLLVAGPQVGEATKGFLQEREIAYYPQHKLTSLDTQNKKLSFDNGQSFGFDLLVAIPPHRSPQPIRTSPLANPTGWVPVDPHSLKTSFDNVYALGDVTFIPLASGLPLPKAGVFAHGEAQVVAQNIARRIKEGGAEAKFEGHGA